MAHGAPGIRRHHRGLAPRRRRCQILAHRMATYLPVYCATCARASLSSAAASEPQVCAFCESAARVVPGPIYGDGDWLAFADVDSAVYEAGLDGAQAAMLAEQLQQLLTEQAPSVGIIEAMIERVPALANCRPALVNGLPRGVRMLMTLLVARSRDRPLSTAEQMMRG
jgi:hypothetical protein